MTDLSEAPMDPSTSDGDPAPKMKISFGVKRAPPVKLQELPQVVVDVSIDSDEEREHEEEARRNKRRKLTHFEDGDAPCLCSRESFQIQHLFYLSTFQNAVHSSDDDDNKKKSAVVIPLVQEHDWRVAKLIALQKEGKLTDEDRAKLAILTEAEPFESTNVPIEEFGLAILRGCGWKEGEGIGRRPQVVPLRILPRRPNGLGLGATPQQPDKKKGVKNGKPDEQLDEELKKGSHIRVTTGRHKGHYGKVEARDDDNNSLFVRLALGGQQVKVSLFAVQQVTKKEYERDSKCINKDDYDKEKDKIEKRNNEAVRDHRKHDDRRDREERSKDKYREKNGASEKDVQCAAAKFIDENYKKGRYFKEKMRVVDVASRKDISLEDSQGKMHYGIRQSSLETVLPRLEKSRVMIVRGKHKGLAATMEEKDKRRCRVVARLLRSNEVSFLLAVFGSLEGAGHYFCDNDPTICVQIVTVDYDDVCQHQPKEEDEDDDY
ncbi:unnamed protein product [Heligmosomoides polygyrus]|uniref:G-patch domain-containing protein n=1 Tax=Heligmosomoides polygyrus TaxID=6339 RepID=A0A183FFC7_HELPZ|nr:unnamed protein product [Heligmosomoides polygyrus]